MSSIFEKVQDAIADALYVDKSEVTRETNLMKDLGAESIDLLDIIFRMEKAFGIKMPKGEIERRARGDLAPDEFAINGALQAKGLARLKQVMPEVDQDMIKPGLYLRDLPSLFTVATIERMVSEQLALQNGEASQGAGLAPRLATT
jgi:acyl carrier protein